MISKRNILIFLDKIAEVYPIGIVKYAPGTFASFIAIILGFNLLTSLGVLNFLFVTCALILLGYFFCEIHIKVYKKKRSQRNCNR